MNFRDPEEMIWLVKIIKFMMCCGAICNLWNHELGMFAHFLIALKTLVVLLLAAQYL